MQQLQRIPDSHSQNTPIYMRIAPNEDIRHLLNRVHTHPSGGPYLQRPYRADNVPSVCPVARATG